MTRPSLALIHSPLVGPMSWRGVAGRLRTMGYPRVEIPDARLSGLPAPLYAALAGRIVGALEGGPWILVGHSGAGGLLPAAAEALHGRVRAMVFVDAILPHPGATWLETAPPALAARLKSRASEGRAPPWPDWFAPSVLEALLPDEWLRAAFVAEAEAAPMAYLAEPAPITPAPPAATCGYLQLSEAYQAEADIASALGWTLAHEPSHHLAMITEPDGTAAALDRLIQALTVVTGSRR